MSSAVSPEYYADKQEQGRYSQESLAVLESAEVIDLRAKSPAQLRIEADNLARQEKAAVVASIGEAPNDTPLCTKRPEYFFGPDEKEASAETKKRERIAAAICSQCSIVNKCFESSVEQQYPFGVWGGVGEKARRDIIRRLAVPRKNHTFDSFVALQQIEY